jgi:hypothetical protein
MVQELIVRLENYLAQKKILKSFVNFLLLPDELVKKSYLDGSK